MDRVPSVISKRYSYCIILKDISKHATWKQLKEVIEISTNEDNSVGIQDAECNSKQMKKTYIFPFFSKLPDSLFLKPLLLFLKFLPVGRCYKLILVPKKVVLLAPLFLKLPLVYYILFSFTLLCFFLKLCNIF
jgi:hypothetical protein